MSGHSGTAGGGRVGEAVESVRSPLRLEGICCSRCQIVRWPRQHYGCENCGAEARELADLELTARGRLRTFATVHAHPDLGQSFTVVEVVLDAGPVVRAVGDAPADGRSGGRVIAARLGIADRPHFEGDSQ